MHILPGDLNDKRVVDLVQHHATLARAATARCSAHALDALDLATPDISFWTIWEGDTLLGCGALKTLSADHGEIKSMHTASEARGKGVASALLIHLIATAKEKGMSRVSLETGVQDYFAPARALYTKHGFSTCLPFADYTSDPNSFYMSLLLEPS